MFSYLVGNTNEVSNSFVQSCLKKVRDISFEVNRKPLLRKDFADYFHKVPEESSYEFYELDAGENVTSMKVNVYRDGSKLLIESTIGHSNRCTCWQCRYIDLLTSPADEIACVLREVSLYPLDAAISKMEYLSTTSKIEEMEHLNSEIDLLAFGKVVSQQA